MNVDFSNFDWNGMRDFYYKYHLGIPVPEDPQVLLARKILQRLDIPSRTNNGARSL